jgi:hypothetical protein
VRCLHADVTGVAEVIWDSVARSDYQRYYHLPEFSEVSNKMYFEVLLK